MAKIPLLECLTRHSYRESLEKSSSPHPKPDGEEGASSQSAILGLAEAQQDQKSPASGESASPGRAGSSGASGLQEALEEAKEQEETEKTDAPSFNVTLLDWINVQDRPNDVEAVVRKCFDSINRVSARRNVSLHHVFKISSSKPIRFVNSSKMKHKKCPNMQHFWRFVDSDEPSYPTFILLKLIA